MTTTDDLPRLPFARADILELARQYREMPAPLSRVRAPAGDVAWLVTGYEEARALFADTRLGRSHPDPDNAARISASVVFGGPMGGDPESERANHAAMRRMLVPAFSARRMARLRDHVGELVARCLDELAAVGPGADLHETLSFPLPVLVICELLGVPFEDRDRFRGWSEGLSSLDDRPLAQSSGAALHGYIRELIERKRAEPAEDVLTDLAALVGDGPGAPDALEGLAGLGSGLLFAGHETTVGRIDVGTMLLLDQPGEWGALATDPSRVDGVVEEILRLAIPGVGGIPRYAHADVEIGDVTIRTGEAVLFRARRGQPGPAGVRRPGPVRRRTRVRASRVRVRALLLRRGEPGPDRADRGVPGPARALPTLRLAVPRSEIEIRGTVLTGGVRSLPVTW